LNTYKHAFMRNCPANGEAIQYSLTIEADCFVPVEAIASAVSALPNPAFHEDMADRLRKLGGRQTLSAVHHGTEIVTERDGGHANHQKWERHYLNLPKKIEGIWYWRRWVERSYVCGGCAFYGDCWWEYRLC
jgi:hypothetical protein